MGSGQDTRSRERELVERLEELLLPHVAYVGLGVVKDAVRRDAAVKLDESVIKGWSTCLAALVLVDGGSIADGLREARRVRAALRHPEPPTEAEVDAAARERLQAETRGLVRDWLGALEGAAAANGGELFRPSLDAAMLPPLPPPVAAAFVASCAERILGVGATREALVLERMSLEDPDLCLPHDVVAWLALRGVTFVP